MPLAECTVNPVKKPASSQTPASTIQRDSLWLDSGFPLSEVAQDTNSWSFLLKYAVLSTYKHNAHMYI